MRGTLAATVALFACIATTAAHGQPAKVANAGFESSRRGIGGGPEGWVAIQHAGPLSYTFKPDAEVRHGGDQSLRIDNVGPEPFGAVYQPLPAAAYRGKTVKLTAWLRTQDAKGSSTGGGAVLTLQAMQGGATIAHEHMQSKAIRGTTDWKRYEITLAIPPAADQVEIGAMLHGPGTMWIDDVELTVEGS